MLVRLLLIPAFSWCCAASLGEHQCDDEAVVRRVSARSSDMVALAEATVRAHEQTFAHVREIAQGGAVGLADVKQAESRLARAHIALQAELAGTLEPFGYRADSAGNYSTGTEGVA